MRFCHNFSGGPGALPLSVLEKTQEAIHEVPGVGLSLLGISHRSALACACPGKMSAMLIESLDLMLLTALRAWDREEGEQDLLIELTREDREPMLAKLRHETLRDEPGVTSAAQLLELSEHFAQAVRVLHRLFANPPA
jgi:hypothetical protein